MSLTEAITTYMSSIEGVLVMCLAVVLFIWMYIRTTVQLRTSGKERLERLQQSLLLYSRVTGPLGEITTKHTPDPEEVSHLVFLLQECKAAPLLTRDIHEQIDAYIRERDKDRLRLLYKSLEREVNRRIEEQSTLLSKLDNPSWGLSFWLLLKPAVPFMTAIAVLIWGLQLYQVLRVTGNSSSFPWGNINAWMRFVSCLIATFTIYLVLRDTKRTSYRATYNLLCILISAVALLHILGLYIAPYILAVQLILYLAGFRLTPNRSRRDRPYAGHDLSLKEAVPLIHEDALPSVSAAIESTDLLPKTTRSDRILSSSKNDRS
ncbi:hypothetical protein J2T13_004755 [Paenibacillus sp. DS2015]|uniref:hypothetical protein n=1 Tax=Paenibacillus sp. DS2015 TaxID=3373917 RepID=UPI003D216C2F